MYNTIKMRSKYPEISDIVKQYLFQSTLISFFLFYPSMNQIWYHKEFVKRRPTKEIWSSGTCVRHVMKWQIAVEMQNNVKHMHYISLQIAFRVFIYFYALCYQLSSTDTSYQKIEVVLSI